MCIGMIYVNNRKINNSQVNKGIKKTIKILVFVATLLVALPMVAWLAIQDSRIQTHLVLKATDLLEEKFNTTVRIGKIDFRPFNRILLLDVYVEDLRGDTLLFTREVSASLKRFSLSNKVIVFGQANAKEAQFNLYTDSTGIANITAFVDAIRGEKKPKSKEDPFTVSLNNVSLSNSVFTMKREGHDTLDYGINFQDLYVSIINARLNNFNIVGDTIGFTVRRLQFEESTGFSVQNLRMEMNFCNEFMNFDRVQIHSMGYHVDLPSFHMQYGSYDRMKDFLNNVHLSGTFNRSTASTGLISHFAPVLRAVEQDFVLEGDFRGTLSDFRLRNMRINTAEDTEFYFDANLTGLPDFKNTLLFFDINSLATNAHDIQSVKLNGAKTSFITLPEQLHAFDYLKYSGTFTGFISDFVAFGMLSSNIGQLSVDMSVKPQDDALSLLRGTIETENFDLGVLTGIEALGKTSLAATLQGKTDYTKQFMLETNANISALEIQGYNYTNIEIDGQGSNRSFIGSLTMDDPNAKLNFMGTIDATDSLPVFDFSAYVPKLDLVKLNLNKQDSLAQASFLIAANFTGSNIDNTKGEVKVLNSFYRNEYGEIKTSDIIISANNTVDSKKISLTSEFVEAELLGKYGYTNIFSSLRDLAFLYLPGLSPDNKKPIIQSTGVENPEFNDYIVKVRLKKTEKFTQVFSPGFSIAENTNVFGIYNPDFQTLSLKVSIPEIALSGNTIKNISIDGSTQDSVFVAKISSPHIQSGNAYLKNVSVSAEAANNNIASSISWNNKTQVKNDGKIDILAQIVNLGHSSLVEINFKPSDFHLNDSIWQVGQSSVIIDSARVAINDFSLSNKDQGLRLSGNISSLPKDSVTIELRNIDLSSSNFYTQQIGYNLGGKLNGYAKVLDLLGTPLFFADLEASNVSLNEELMGDLFVLSQWLVDENRLNLSVKNTFEGEPMMTVLGDLFPKTKALNINVDIKKFLLSHIEPILAKNVTGIKGYIAGEVALTGTFNEPKLNGMLNLVDVEAFVGFTQTRYRISDPIYLSNSNLIFDGLKLYDINNRLAVLNGSIRTDYFKDIKLDLSLMPSNFQFLNTTELDNEQFYGSVFASGQIRVSGSPANLAINASVRTDQRTTLFLPLSSSSEVSESDFVNIINRSDDIIIIQDDSGADEQKSKPNLNLTLDMEVTPDAEVQIIIDKQMGDIIKATGSGNLKLEINPAQGDFNMFGQYGIENGDYLFTLQGVINKRFKIGQGSTITWNGDLTDALMDINAIYSLRTTLSSLSPDSEDEVFKRRTQVDCHINLTGKLMEPTIGFDIKVPLAETHESINAVFQDAINTEERLSRQFLSLLVVNSFTSDVQLNNMGGFGQQGFATTAGEMISNQMSNWLSQISNTIDIGFNWKPGDEISSDEIELAFSTQLFNDRVTINSNVDYGNQNVNAPLAGDFSVDVKILPSGKLRAKAFVRSNDDILMGEHQGDLTTGAGLMYREDFNTFKGLWERYVIFFSRKFRKEEEEVQPDDNLGVGRSDIESLRKTLSEVK